MSTINVSLEAFGIVMSVILLIICILTKIPNKVRKTVFFSMAALNTAGLICDLLTWVMMDSTKYSKAANFINLLVYIIGYTLTVLFNVYILSFLNYSKKTKTIILNSVIFLCICVSVLAVFSMFGDIFFVLENGYYFRGTYYWLSQAIPAAILVFDAFLIFLNSKKIGVINTLSLTSYIALPFSSMILQIFTENISFVFLATTVSLFLVFIELYIRQMHRLKEHTARMKYTSMYISLSQIQPHFVCNARCGIQDLAAEKAPEAAEAANDLSKFIRGNIEAMYDKEPIPFEYALQHVKYYLSLEKKRFEERVNVKYDLKATDFKIPALTMQPMVENAIRHGICKRKEGGTVTIATREATDAYIIEIIDDGVGFDTSKPASDDRPHIGVSIVRRRVEEMSGGSVSVESEIGKGTKVTIFIPKEAEHNENNSGRR